MKNDIFNSSTGMDDFKYCCAATGDIVTNDIYNAIGDINSLCTRETPYPESQLSNLRNMVAVATNNQAMAEAEFQRAYAEYFSCKQKLLCRAGKREPAVNDTRAKNEAAKLALNAAKNELEMAEKANKTATDKYNECVQQQTEIEKLEIKDIEVNPQANTENVVGIASSSNVKYGLIGVGALVVLVIGYFIVKKS
jgi:hypothetical protein